MLKNFPAKSLNQTSAKAETIKVQTANKEVSMPQEAVQTEGLIDFSEVKKELAPSGALADGFKILGEMLKTFRQNRLMSMLMICRQIQKIEVENGVAEIFSDSDEVYLLISNEAHKAEMDKFFSKFGLSYKIKEKEHKISPVDVLNDLLGGKLVIK